VDGLDGEPTSWQRTAGETATNVTSDDGGAALRQVITERNYLQQQLQHSRRETLDKRIAREQTEADAAEAEYSAAFDAGDASAMATAQRKIAKAEARARKPFPGTNPTMIGACRMELCRYWLD
jgi:hypothetical protein